MKIYDVAAHPGRIGISALPGGSGDLTGDVNAIADWGASLVVTLVGDAELGPGDQGQLSDLLAARDVAWHHLPVTDFGVPSADVAAEWPEVAASANRILDDDGRVLVHCRGGCGRSGMIALRLMIDRGEAPNEALSRLRDVRSCAVETEAQFLWASMNSRRSGSWPGPGARN